MSSPEEVLLNTYHSIRNTTLHTIDVLDSHIDHLADKLRDKLSHSNWIPESYRPSPSPPSPPPSADTSLASVFLSPTRLYHGASHWARRNKLLATAIISTLTLGTAYSTHSYLLRRNRKKIKRRAVRAANGARTQVVVLSGYPHEQTTSLLALDLEKRGFIVFIIVHTPEEEASVLRGVGEGRPDIRPLMLDLASPEAQLERFTSWLLSPQNAFEGGGKSGRYYLNLVGLVAIPSLANYQSAPIEILDGGIWSDTININLLKPIVTVKSFLRPLATFNSRLVILQPVIVSSLAPPFCALETVVGRGIEAWVSVLEREVSVFGVGVSLIKVGNIEGIVNISQNQQQTQSSQSQSFPFFTPSAGSSRNRTPSPNSIPIPPSARADVLSWPAPLRQSYARQFLSSIGRRSSSSLSSSTSSAVKGAPIRELYIVVFDALGAGIPPGVNKGPGKFVFRVGTGSRVYEFLGKWLPRGLIGWMLGVGGWGTVAVPREGRRAISGLIGNGTESIGPGLGEEKDGGGLGGGLRAATPEWEKVDRLV